MDLRNLCSKIDVDSIKAKFPQMPTMPHIRIPKSLPKLKSRKIFRSSREEVRASVKQSQRELSPATLSVPPIQPAGFINRTPTRISTISSLMNEYSTGFRRSASDSIEQYEENTYRSAHSIEDDYPSPYSVDGARYGNSTSESPVKRRAVRGNSSKVTASSNSVKMSLGEKLQKSYKDFSEFRFKNILTKKTTVRRDNIVVDYYVQRYREDRVVEDREQMRRDQRIADNYRFNFKESRQNTEDSLSMSLSNSPTAKKSEIKEDELPQNQKIRNARKSVSEKSDDESGMEASPPKRVPKGSNSLVETKRRRPLRRDISQNSNPDEHTIEMHEAKHAPITSSLWAIKNNQAPRVSSENGRTSAAEREGHRERMRRLTSSVSSHEESVAESVTTKSAGSAGYTLPRSKLPCQQFADENRGDNKPVNAIKHNMKCFKSTISIKHEPPKISNGPDDEDGHNATRSPTTQTTMREKLTARLRRLKSGEASSVEDIAKDGSSPKKSEAVENSPLRATFNKFQTWKKAFRNKPEYPGTGDEGSPEKQTHSSILIEKLKYIRNRKNPNTVAMDSDDGLEKEATGETRKTHVNTMEKFEKARQRTFKKVNDKMHKMKIFHKSQENIGKDIETTLRNISPPPRRPPRIPKDEYEHSSEEDDIEDIPTRNSAEDYSVKKKIHAMWTTNPILSESTESEDNATEYPRVLIHQDNSDAFESTLIIAVTTAASSQKPRITEILPEPTPESTPKELDWIPNKEIMTEFLNITPPAERKLSLACIGKKASLTRGHKRNQSMDSNSDSNSDPWVPKSAQNQPLFATSRDVSRRASGGELDSIQENEKPWSVHTMHPKNLYKTRSIDIFGENIKYNGVQEPFEDFDDHLRNEPVLKIARKSYSEDESLSKESGEEPDAADDDNSSRITKIRMENISEERLLLSNSPQFSLNEDYQQRQIGNSRESLDANFDENEEFTDDDDDYDDEDDDDRPPSVAPSPPPSFSPPPPPLPQRQPLMRLARPAVLEPDAVPPLPTSKPPAPSTRQPPQIPERTESMASIPKPLVKTSSLRLAYTEQVKPADVGKVNKLISRFEQPTPEQNVPTRTRALEEDYLYYKEEEEDEDDEWNGDEQSIQTETEDDLNNNDGDNQESMTTPTNMHLTLPIWKQDSLDEGAVGEIVRTTKKRVAPKPEPATTAVHSATTAQVTTSLNSRDDENNNRNSQADKLSMALKQDAVGEIKAPQINTKCDDIYTVKHLNIPKLTLTSDLYTQNIPQSQESSEYGSPLEYPSSLIGSTETTPTPGRKQQQEWRTPGRRIRSMVRDDDQYYSFDSDDENSYYSISSVGSNRYVVEI